MGFGEFWVFGLSLLGWFRVWQACCVVLNFCLNAPGLPVLVFRIWIGDYVGFEWFCWMHFALAMLEFW